MSQNDGTNIWFEIPTNDLEKAKGFYGEVFLWKFTPVSDTYSLIRVGEQHIGGLSLEEKKVEKSNGPIIYLKIASIDESAEKITAMGGSLASEKTTISDEDGSFQHFRDRDGNRLSLWQASQTT